MPHVAIDAAPPQPALRTLRELPSQRRFPSDWQVIGAVDATSALADLVIVGPNGVFVVVIDPDPSRSRLTASGIVRAGERVADPVRAARLAGFELRRALRRDGIDTLVSAIVVSPVGDEGGWLDRVRVVPVHRLREAVWSHPGSPLTRGQRDQVAAIVASMAG